MVNCYRFLSSLNLNPGNLINPVYFFNVFHQIIENGFVLYHYNDLPCKYTVVTVKMHAFHIYMVVAGNYLCYAIDQPNGVYSGNIQHGLKFLLGAVYPFGGHNPVAVVALQLQGVRTIGFVYFYALVHGNETENIVAWNGIAAIGHFVIQFIFAFAEHELVKFLGYFFLIYIFGTVRFPDTVFEEAYKCIAPRGSKVL